MRGEKKSCWGKRDEERQGYERACLINFQTNSSMIECRLERDSQHGTPKKMQNMPSQKNYKAEKKIHSVTS